MSEIEYILHCLIKSEEGFGKDIKDNIEDYSNIFYEYIIPFIKLKEINIAIIGLSNVGKTSFIEKLGGILEEENTDYSIYKIYRENKIINMYEFSSKNMYKNMNKKYNIDGIILIVDTQRISYFYGLPWFQEMYKNNDNIQYIFLRNKVELSSESLFDPLYHTWNISVKNNYGVEKALQNLLNKFPDF